MRPRTTVAIEVPYPGDSIEAIRSGEADRLGLSHLDEARFSFELEAVK